MNGPPPSPTGTACHEPVAAARRRLEEEVWVGVRDALASARSAHRASREETGLHRQDPPDEGPGPRARLLEYLDQMERRVHQPLTGALDRIRPLASSLGFLHEGLDAATEAAAALPATLPPEEATGGPEAARGAPDSALGRLAVRIRGGGPEATVPVRWLAGRHVRLRLARGVDRWSGQVAREWAVWLADLEVAWARWAGAVLRTLPGPADPDPAAGWGVSVAAAEALDETLARLEDRCPLEPPSAEMEGDLDHWERSLAQDLELAGTFLLRTGGSLPTRPRPRTDAEGWSRWEEEVVERFRLHDHLLDAATGLPTLASRVAARLGTDVRAGWREKAHGVADALEADAEALARDGDRRALEEARRRAGALLGDLEEVLPASDAFREAADKAADATVASLQALLRGLPESLTLHPPLDADELPRGPSPHGRSLRLRELARHAFDALRVERVRTAPAAVVPLAGTVADALSATSEVVGFGFDAAGAELDEGADGARTRARELAAEALTRAAEALRSAGDPLDRALAEVEGALARELHAGSAVLLERALADRLEGTLLEARSRLATAWERVRARSGTRIRAWTEAAKRRAEQVRRQARRLARRGRELVAARDEVAVGTGRLLAAPEEVLGSLPLVYQRLFTWTPVEDETLMAGRGAALTEAARRWIRWQRQDGIPLIVTGRPGVGVSSFVRVFAGRIRSHGGTALHHSLERRLTEETELAEHLSALLDLPTAESLDELAATILESPEQATPQLVVLEALEHVYLRVPGGTDLLERLLTLMAETEPRVFWMATLTSSAWQLLEVSEPTAVAQVDRLELPALDAEALREAILLRHRRSGVPLAWEEPAEGRRLLRRRLARARGQEARYELLDRDFFDRLHRVTGGNLRLAFFQWLRAADFETREGSLTIRPRRELDLTFLDALGPTTHFTLKALLEHGTLTLDEHDRIFRMPRQESYQVFEALGNRHVIQVVPGSDADGPVSEAVDSARYRINPLLIGGVTAVLSGRNIIH